MSARKSAEKPLLALIDIDRIPRALLCGFLVLGCLIACSLGMAARHPFLLAAETRAENELLAQRYMKLKYETQQLERRVAEIQTPEGREREARMRGYLKPDET